MQNAEIARLLGEVADLLEISAGNPFKVRAYRNAARTVADHPDPVAQLVKEEAFDLRDLPGIGGGIAKEIDRKSTRLNSSHVEISYAVFCLKKKKKKKKKYNKQKITDK